MRFPFVSMPGMTGFEAAQFIGERAPDVRVIFVSSHTAPAFMEEAFKLGADGYVVKGSATLQLPLAIKDVLDGKVFRPM